jgi:stress response protein YsnF
VSCTAITASAVPKERVRMDKDTVTEERQVSEQVREEQIDMLDADGEPDRGIDGVRGTDEDINRK